MPMSRNQAAFWSGLPDEAHHPTNVFLVEALWRIGEPLSARAMVDVLDGEVSIWEAERHMRDLEMLGVVEPPPSDPARGVSEVARLDVPYRLIGRGASENG